MDEQRVYDVQGYEAVDSHGRRAGAVARAVTGEDGLRIHELVIEPEGGARPVTVAGGDIRHIDDLGRRVVLRPSVVPELAGGAYDEPGQERLTLRAEQPDIQVTARRAGEVRIHLRVEQRRAAVEVPLREERAIIARFDPAGDDPDPALAFVPYAVAAPVRCERPAVSRRTVVAEEVIIRRQAATGTVQVPLTLRRERLAVDDPQGLAHHAGGPATATHGETAMERGQDPGVDPNSMVLSDEAVALGTAIIGERSAEYTFNADGSFREDSGPALGLPVLTPSGDVLGTVAEVTEDRFKVSAPLARDYWLPITAITGQAPGGDLVISAVRDDLHALEMNPPAP